jgi:hypothetical protein
MMRYLTAVLLLLFLAPVAAAQQQCVCTAGCKIASDPYPPPAVNQPDSRPTSCTVTVGGAIVNAPVVASSTILLSNSSICSPASSTYVPGVVGSVACLVAIPSQANGTTVTATMTATNVKGETLPSAPYTFQSVSALTVLPSVPVNLRTN